MLATPTTTQINPWHSSQVFQEEVHRAHGHSDRAEVQETELKQTLEKEMNNTHIKLRQLVRS